MLITTATLTEAKPIIERLNLKQVQKRPFALFSNGHSSLLVTGIGALNAAAAVSHIVTQPLLNFGLCAGSDIGKLYNIKKVIDDCSDKSYILPTDPNLPNASLRTVAKPATSHFRELVDMEAAGIVVAAKKFGITPKIVKIVSDSYDPSSVTLKLATSLIEANIEQLLDIITKFSNPTKESS